LLLFLERKSSLDNAPAAERDAFAYVRKEAIDALGHTRYPARLVEVDKKTKKIERTTALTLLKVLRNDGVSPAPRIEEQISAAVGLCHLQTRLLDQYNADYAAQHIGRVFVEFFNLYNNRQGQERKDPWKLYAAHLARALEDFKNDVAGPPAHDAKNYVFELTAQIDPLLKEVIEPKETTVDVAGLAAWLDAHPAKNQTVYKGVPTAIVRAAEKAAE
jgi:hypothetical protein